MTALARSMTLRRYLLFPTLVTALLIALGIGIVYRADKPENKTIQIGGTRLSAEIVTSEVLQGQGLSGRDSIGKNQAMVFSYEKPKQLCFWMKDMKFAIDMVWLDSSKKVVATEQNVKPDTYPKNFCHDGQYVVELAANSIKQLDLKSGDTVKF